MIDICKKMKGKEGLNALPRLILRCITLHVHKIAENSKIIRMEGNTFCLFKAAKSNEETFSI